MRQHIKQGLAAVANGAGVNRRKLRQGGCVILMMHKINDLFDPLPLTLSPERFARMIEEIQRSSEIVPLDRATEAAASDVGGLSFVMTFDDGYRDNYEQALPILERYRVPATIYISVDHVDGRRSFWYETLISAITDTKQQHLDLSDLKLGSFSLEGRASRIRAITELNQTLKQYDTETRERLVAQVAELLGADEASGSSMLSWEMVREMGSKGVSIGSHTMSHPILSRESRERVRLELRDSKARLEAELQGPVEAFAYPNGRSEDFNGMVVEEAKEAGYSSAVTTMPGINTAGTDRFMLRRIEVHNRMCSDLHDRFSPALFWANVFGMFQGYWA